MRCLALKSDKGAREPTRINSETSSNNDDINDAMNSLPSLSQRREKITTNFFISLLDPTSCLHHLIPEKRDADFTTRLRLVKQYLPPITRTERFKKSSVVYALENYLS